MTDDNGFQEVEVSKEEREYYEKNKYKEHDAVAEQIFKEKRQERKRELNESVMKKYIFDKNKVNTRKPFPSLKINDKFGFGILLPREKELQDRKGKTIGSRQIYAPVIVTSEAEILDVINDKLESDKIQFKDIPSELDGRWSLGAIPKFIYGTYPKIQGAKLFSRIKKIYQKYLYFQSDAWYSVHAIWDIGTYLFMLFTAYPIFELRGLKDTAKTKTMAVSSFLSLNSTGILINPSESTLFRETHEKRPTKYIDEAEKLFTYQKNKIVADPRIDVINASYYCKGRVPRVEKRGDKWITEYYDCYSPTMIGSINGLRGSTEDRALVHITIRAPSSDKRGDIEPTDDSEDWQQLRDDLYAFALQNHKPIENIYTSMQNTTKLKTRDYQIWKPLLAIAKFLNNELYSDILKHAETQTNIKSMNDLSEGSIEHEIIVILYGLLDKDNKNKPIKILNKDIRNGFADENKPHPKTITKHMTSFGFRDSSDHWNDGNGWKLSFMDFELLITPIFSSFHSLSSYYNSNHDDKTENIEQEEVKKDEDNMNESEAKTEIPKRESEGNEGNEASEGESDKRVFRKWDDRFLVWLKCYVEDCNETPCNFDSKGIPYCKKHFEEIGI